MNRFIALNILLLFCLTATAQDKKPADYVNPFVGTDFHGHTYPGATVPYGMVQLSPDTRLEGWDGCSGYHYSDSLIYGFSHTHLSGTGCSDYGDILVAPYVSEQAQFSNAEYSSAFLKKNETASAGYYSVLLSKHEIKAELTATKRVGLHKYTFKKNKNAWLTVDLAHRDKSTETWIKVVSNSEIHGFRRSTEWASDQHLYFVMRFSTPFATAQFYSANCTPNDTTDNGFRKVSGTALVAALNFPTIQKKQLLVKVALSAVSAEGALQNLDAELAGWDFDNVLQNAKGAWNTELGKIEVSSTSPDLLTNFYTALYHCMIVPNIYSDVNGQYRGMDGNIKQADGFTPYTVFSLWDTYRAWHPLMTIIDTTRVNSYINTFLSHFRYGGRLPVWELSANETDCMIGYHSVSVIADAWQKGIRGFDSQLALRAMIHSAKLNHFGLKELKRFNFIPGDMEHEAVSKTLEYAYDDWCIALMAKNLNDTENYQLFSKRAQAYKNIFDPKTHLMRPRLNGGWKSNFNPTEVDQNFTEANSWQYSFYVPHDISGLIELHGGSQNFEQKLDELFTASSQLSGRNQSDITGLIGQYAHGNEPSHHMAYLYSFVGKPWKTQERVRQILDEMYKPTPAGICGNEDCGQMSAWYVLSALGFYPVCPGSTQYTIGSPIFDVAKINLENGKVFTISSENNSVQNIYIKSISLNGKPLNRCYITHNEIVAGGALHFTMSSTADTTWDASQNEIPQTKIDAEQITVAPAFTSSARSFTSELQVEIGSIQLDAIIYHTVLDFDNPSTTPLWKQGSKITLTQSAIVRIYAVRPNGITSSIIEGKFVKVQDINKIEIKSKYDNLYTGGGDLALVDGLRGALNFRLGGWQGYNNQDFEAIVDLGEVKTINQISAGFLQDTKPWIMMPQFVEFYTSTDNINFTKIGHIDSDVDDNNQQQVIKNFCANTSTKARYVKVFAKSFGKLPTWHISAGQPSWLFIDEIMVK